MNAEKYTTKVREALETAQNVARHHGQQQIDVEHLLFHRERAELVTRFPAFIETL